MKKTLIAVAIAAFVSTGAIAKPMSNHAPHSHNSHSVHMVHHDHKPVHHVHYAAPAPVVVHHNHHHNDGIILLGDALIAFAILASANM